MNAATENQLEESNSREKLCLVCGDKALGFNFNAITCESCKAFFRRNALKDKEFKCPFNKKCEINIVTRRFCQLCRLIKCFEVGMKKEFIMTEDEKLKKRIKIGQKKSKIKEEEEEPADLTPKKAKTDNINPLNMAAICSKPYQRLKHDQGLPGPSEPASPVGSSLSQHQISELYNSSSSRSAEIYQISKNRYKYEEDDEDSSSSDLPCSVRKNVSTKEKPDCMNNRRSFVFMSMKSRECSDAEPRQMPLLESLVNGKEESTRSGSFQADIAEEVLQDIPRKNNVEFSKSSIESILSEAIKLEYEAYSSLNPRINSRELNDAERAKLNELIVANKALLAPVDDDISNLMGHESISKKNSGFRPVLVDVLNLTAIAIRRLIKMAKKVNAFKNMCQEDQVALLKGGCTEMMILRSAMTYDSDRGSWKIPHSEESLMNIKVDVLKEAGGKVFEEHQRFLQTFDPKWRQDENIMLILSAITLFTPDRPRVVHYDVIKLEQNSYYYLLRRYLESTYPGCEARSTFLKLIHKIAELHKLNEDHVRVYMEQNPEDVEPLLIEIFDLNPH